MTLVLANSSLLKNLLWARSGQYLHFVYVHRAKQDFGKAVLEHDPVSGCRNIKTQRVQGNDLQMSPSVL